MVAATFKSAQIDTKAGSVRHHINGHHFILTVIVSYQRSSFHINGNHFISTVAVAPMVAPAKLRTGTLLFAGWSMARCLRP